jgi:hypothetical protein
MIVLLAFACLGFLIGNLVGLSSENTVAIIIPLLFTFGGGSAIAFLHKLDVGSRRMAATSVIALSLSCLLGVYSGIIVCEHQLLTPKANRTSILAERPTVDSRKLVKDLNVSAVQAINIKYRTGDLSAEDAYNQLYELVSSGSKQ